MVWHFYLEGVSIMIIFLSITDDAKCDYYSMRLKAIYTTKQTISLNS